MAATNTINNWTIEKTGANTLTFGGTNPSIIANNAGLATLTINPDMVLGATLAVSNTTVGMNIRLNGNISGAGSLKVMNTGVVVLSGSNSFNGLTATGGGTVQVSTANNLGAGPVTLQNGYLDLRNDAGTDFGHAIAMNSGGNAWINVDRATDAGTGGTHILSSLTAADKILYVTGSNGYNLTISTVTTSNGLAITNSSLTSLLTLGNYVTTATAARTATLGGNGNYSVGSFLEGTSTSLLSVTKSGAGKLTLSGSSNYTGNLAVSGGTLEVLAGGVLGTGTNTVSSTAQLILNAAANLPSGKTVTLAGGTSLAPTASLLLKYDVDPNSILSGTSSTGGTVLLGVTNPTNVTGFNNSKAFIGSNAASVITNVGIIAGGTEVLNKGTNPLTTSTLAAYRFGGGTGSVKLTGVNALTGSSQLLTNGNVELAAANDFAGSISILSGTLRASAANALGTTFTDSSRSIKFYAGNATTAAAVLAISNNDPSLTTITADNGGGGGIISLEGNFTSFKVGYNGATQQSTFIGSAATGTVTLASGANFSSGNGSTTRLGGAGGTLTLLGSNIFTAGNVLTIGQDKPNGGGTVVIANNQNYTGATTITGVAGANVGSMLIIESNSALGTTAAATTVGNGSTLALRGGFSYLATETVSLTGAGLGGNGVLRSLNGDNSFAGRVILTGNSTVGVDAASLTLNGTVTGAFAITKIGGGSLIFGASNSYSGGTTLGAGTLKAGNANAFGLGAISITGGTLDLSGVNVTNTITNNGGAILLPTSTAALATNFANGSQYGGWERISTGALGIGTSTARLLAGTSGAIRSVTTTWTTNSHNFAVKSDVLSLDGTVTDLFVLQMSSTTVLPSSSYLAWYNTGSGQWVKAVEGNTSNNATDPMKQYQGGFAMFQGVYGSTLTDYIGAYGVDTSNGVVWAVVNHNSEFAVVPEPAALSLLALGGLALLRRRRVKD